MGNSNRIHPSALVDPRAELAYDVRVGAYSIINGGVTIAPGSTVFEHCVLQGPTAIGRNCRIGPGACLGGDPQHAWFVHDEAAPTYLVIGDNVIIRECARLNRSTTPGIEHATQVGDGCFIMGAAHVGHDSVMEADVVLADSALLGGHCHVGRKAFIGGGCTIHQFVRVGRLSIIAGNEASSHDVPPFGAMRYGRLKGYNAIGCRRAGMSREAITAIRGCYHRLHAHRTTSAAVAAIRAELPDLPEVRELLAFIQQSKRGILPSTASRAGNANLDPAAAHAEG